MSAIDVLYWHGKVHTFENPLSGRINYTSKLFHSYLKITIDMLNIYLKADQYRITSSLKSCYKTLGCIQKCISIISIFRPVNKSNLSVCLSVFLSFSVCLSDCLSPYIYVNMCCWSLNSFYFNIWYSTFTYMYHLYSFICECYEKCYKLLRSLRSWNVPCISFMDFITLLKILIIVNQYNRSWGETHLKYFLYSLNVFCRWSNEPPPPQVYLERFQRLVHKWTCF